MAAINRDGRSRKRRKRINEKFSCTWQNAPDDIMQLIIQNLSLWDRVKLRMVCKSWRSVPMRKDIRSSPSEKPWLLSTYSNKENISFFSLTDSKVHELPLPKELRGTWVYMSCKGNLVMVKGLFSKVVLLNPISGAHMKLPSLTSVFPHFAALKELKEDVVSTFEECFCDQVVLSSSDIRSEGCIVAAIFGCRILALCRPGDRTWRIVLQLEKSATLSLDDLLFSCGKLYVLVHRRPSNDIEIVDVAAAAARVETFGEHTVEVNFVYDFNPPHPTCWLIRSYLMESVGENEVFLIHQTIDCTPQTVSFIVHKVDEETGMFPEVKNLGNQIIFLSELGSSSIASAVSKENCIYFSTFHYKERKYETGRFYPESGKIEAISCPKLVEVNIDVGIVRDTPNGGWRYWFAPNLH